MRISPFYTYKYNTFSFITVYCYFFNILHLYLFLYVPYAYYGATNIKLPLMAIPLPYHTLFCLCIAARVSGVGRLTDVQVGWCDSTAHAQGLSHLKREADDPDIIRWCHCHYTYVEGWELYKESVHEPWGSCLGFWLHYIQLHFMRSHGSSLVATSVPLEEWDYNLKGKCPVSAPWHPGQP